MAGKQRAPLVLPETPKSTRPQLRVSGRMGDLFVPEVMLDRPGVYPFIRQVEPRSVTQHVRMDGKWDFGLATSPGDQLPNG